MKLAGVSVVVLAAALTAACGGADGVSASPTGPSTTTTATVSSQPQPSCMPATPTNLAVTSVKGTIVSLAWSPVSGATEYLVLVGTTPSSSDTLSTNTTHPDYAWTVKNGKHFARVQAKNSCGTSGSSNEVEFTVG